MLYAFVAAAFGSEKALIYNKGLVAKSMRLTDCGKEYGRPF